MKQMTLIEFFGREDAPTQADVAERAGIKQPSFNHYVNGRRTPSQADAAMIAKVTGEDALYAHWYPSLEQQLERMALTDPTPTQSEERING